MAFVSNPATTSAASIGAATTSELATEKSGRESADAERVAKSLIDAKGDLFVGTADNTVARQAIGADETLLKAASGEATGVKWEARAPIVWYESKVFTVPDEIKVPSGDTDFIPPFIISLRTGQTAKIVKVLYKINGGTSATVKLQKNGSDLTGFTAIEVKTEKATTDPTDQAIADADVIALVVTAVSGSPKNLSFAVIVEHTVV